MKHKTYIIVALAIALLALGSSASAAGVSFRPCADAAPVFSVTKNNRSVSQRSLALEKARLEISGKLFERWAQKDMEKSVERERVARSEDANFAALERSLANAPDDHKRALAAFRSALETASNERQLAIDTANDNFRAGVLNYLNTATDGCAFRSARLLGVARHQAEIRAATADFKAKVVTAQAALKAALTD